MSVSDHVAHSASTGLLGDLPEFRRDPLGLWLRAGIANPVAQIQLGPTRTFWSITDADLIQHILQQNYKNYPRHHRVRTADRMGGPETVFNAASWEEWLWRRRLLQPSFHVLELQRVADQILNETRCFFADFDSDAPISLLPAMKRLTMQIIGRTMFSNSFADTPVLQQHFEQCAKCTYQKIVAYFDLPMWIPTPLHIRTRRSIRARKLVVSALVQDRLQSGEAKGDLLDSLISAHLEDSESDKTHQRFTGDDLVREIISIIFAGHETTAITLCWLLYMIATNESVEAKLLQEMQDLLGDGDPTFEDAHRMPYTAAVIKETLRLYPPVYMTLREAIVPDQCDDLVIPTRVSLGINIRALHRTERYWQEPERFWPERFLGHSPQPSHKFAFLPFLAGPKKCIGDSFAMLELGVLLPTILRRYRLRFTGDRPPQPKPGFVLSFEEDMMIAFETRQNF